MILAAKKEPAAISFRKVAAGWKLLAVLVLYIFTLHARASSAQTAPPKGEAVGKSE